MSQRDRSEGMGAEELDANLDLDPDAAAPISAAVAPNVGNQRSVTVQDLDDTEGQVDQDSVIEQGEAAT
jgi:hypothetical protein